MNDLSSAERTRGGRYIIETGDASRLVELLNKQIRKDFPQLDFSLVRVYNSGYDEVARIAIQGIDSGLNFDESQFCHEFHRLSGGHGILFGWDRKEGFPKEWYFTIFLAPVNYGMNTGMNNFVRQNVIAPLAQTASATR